MKPIDAKERRFLATCNVLTTGRIARICQTAARTVSKWIDSGALRGYRIPGSEDRRVSKKDLIAFMRLHGLPDSDFLNAETAYALLAYTYHDALCISLRAALGDLWTIQHTRSAYELGSKLSICFPHVLVVDLAGGAPEVVGILAPVGIFVSTGMAGNLVVAGPLNVYPSSLFELCGFCHHSKAPPILCFTWDLRCACNWLETMPFSLRPIWQDRQMARRPPR